jgi:hypothetical protein
MLESMNVEILSIAEATLLEEKMEKLGLGIVEAQQVEHYMFAIEMDQLNILEEYKNIEKVIN